LADHVLSNLDNIAAYLQVSRRTVTRWIDDFGLPAMQTPRGTWVTTTRLIDQWILAVNKVQADERKREKHFEDLIDRTQ
jgi:excisionase family DNA binding protein